MTAIDCSLKRSGAIEGGASLRSAPVILPAAFNYIGAFLTFRCPYRCSYCINRIGSAGLSSQEVTAGEWVDFFARLDSHGVPVTLQGGEPGLHPGFLDIVEGILLLHPVDILTNLAFDLGRFVDRIDPNTLNRPAPYAPIRVSYHPEQFGLEEIVAKVLFLQKHGFRVGLYVVTHPRNGEALAKARSVCENEGIDLRTKPFLGWHEGRFHGEYAYPDACDRPEPVACDCAGSELLIAPDGRLYRCHHHLYNQIDSYAKISDMDIAMSDDFARCHWYGQCNPCDVKLKNNRFQQFGHVSVRIRRPA